METWIIRTTHTYNIEKEPHVFTQHIKAKSKIAAMDYIKKRYPVEEGYKSDIVGYEE